jgi:hypothetical protein
MLAGYLEGDTLREVVRGLVRVGATVVLEGLTALHMWRIEAPEEEWTAERDPAAQETGQMFDNDFELRWQRLRGYPSHIPPFRARLITDDVGLMPRHTVVLWQSTAGIPAQIQNLSLAGGGAFYLWGEAIRNSPEKGTENLAGWYEKEVPRVFHYPIEAGNSARRVKVITKSYTFHAPSTTDSDQNFDDVEDGNEPTLSDRFISLVPAED